MRRTSIGRRPGQQKTFFPPPPPPPSKCEQAAVERAHGRVLVLHPNKNPLK